MNKILKIIIKSDPIFKYIVEDYPFYEGAFFHSKDFYKINILNSHYLLKQRLKINKGSAGFFYIPKYLMHLVLNINPSSPKFLVNPKSKIKTKIKVYILNNNHLYMRLSQKLKSYDKNYLKYTITPHMIKLIRLKTHDPYTLENRDMLTLSNMDGEKIL